MSRTVPATRPAPYEPHSDRAETVRRLHETPQLALLSRRQVEVAWLVAERLTDKQIAGRLGIDVVTVRTYRKRIYARLEIAGCECRVALALLVRRVVDAWAETDDDLAA